LSRRFWLAAVLLALPACHHDGNAELAVNVRASGSPPQVFALEVTITTDRAGVSSPPQTYAHDGQPIDFPTTFSAQIPAYATGMLTVDVAAQDAAGTTVATGRSVPVAIGPGEHKTVSVTLSCGGDMCVVDGGMGNNDDGGADGNPSCGNGRIDVDETCDIAIAPADPGACPATCDDGVPCTTDTTVGSDCKVTCKHIEITTHEMDGCCAAGGFDKNGAPVDPDCRPECGNGLVDKDETCDIKIPRGTAGACPTPADCMKPAACATGMLISNNTCNAICVRYPIVAPADGDGCCPPGATHDMDKDCEASCGNGVMDTGESCDVAIPPLGPGACPTSCDDGMDSTLDILSGSGCSTVCQHVKITLPISGDGYCLPGATSVSDSDCPPACGNGVIERGETCDGNCPSSCGPTPSACLRNELQGDPDACTARCVPREVKACALAKDGCCPAGCRSTDDPDPSVRDGDCSPRCGDRLVETTLGEVCDTMALPGSFDTCPTSCDDSDPCTEDRLLSAGTCAARCVHIPITALRAGDGCCPHGIGSNFMLDPDCTPSCGNGVVETPAERCDWGAGCPSGQESCPPSFDSCTRYTFQGSVTQCTAACVASQITTCVDNDSCCAPGCTHANDSDCPVTCGDGIVEDGEACDRAITAGMPGACPRTCDDGEACTVDIAAGLPEACTRTCTHVPISGCLSGDGCCPAGCSAVNDSDCAPTCPDGKVEAGETCDPPTTCPDRCPDDGDPCTKEQMVGASATCNAACRHVPITACSGSQSDACCPTGCARTSDRDCL